MTVPSDLDEPSDEAIDNDLRLDGFDPDDRYPEHGHDALRTAYRNGYESGQLRAVAAESELRALREARDRVLALHRAVPTYEMCPKGFHGCDSNQCVDDVHTGGRMHTDERLADACAECCDEDGGFIDYPCATVAALNGFAVAALGEVDSDG